MKLLLGNMQDNAQAEYSENSGLHDSHHRIPLLLLHHSVQHCSKGYHDGSQQIASDPRGLDRHHHRHQRHRCQRRRRDPEGTEVHDEEMQEQDAFAQLDHHHLPKWNRYSQHR